MGRAIKVLTRSMGGKYKLCVRPWIVQYTYTTFTVIAEHLSMRLIIVQVWWTLVGFQSEVVLVCMYVCMYLWSVCNRFRVEIYRFTHSLQATDDRGREVGGQKTTPEQVQRYRRQLTAQQKNEKQHNRDRRWVVNISTEQITQLTDLWTGQAEDSELSSFAIFSSDHISTVPARCRVKVALHHTTSYCHKRHCSVNRRRTRPAEQDKVSLQME